jgi:hypothetical protein
MAANARGLRTTSAFLSLARTRIRRGLASTAALLITTSGLAQQPTLQQPIPPPESKTTSQDAATSAKTTPETTTVTVPAGTRIALVLTQPIQTRYIHHGDDIYAQTVSPVTAGKEAVIPPGTFVQGTVDKLERHGGRAEVRLQSMSITFPDGYVARMAGPLTLQSADGYAVKDPGPGRVGGAVALAAGGVGMGALIGHLVNSQDTTITNSLPPGCTGPPPGCLSSTLTEPGSGAKSTIIGAVVGGTIGGVAAIALLFSSHDFYLYAGSPVEMVLQHDLTLEEDQVEAAIRDAEQHPAAEGPIAPPPQLLAPANTDPGVCYTPGTPGTPDTDIPGTPAIGDSPGTPPIHIPGIPPTPPTPHPCP